MPAVERFGFDVQPATRKMELRLAWAALLRRQLNFGHEARLLLDKIEPPLKTLGSENVPTAGSYIITPNHLFWPGFQAWWLAAAISSVTPVEIHWIMTAAWTNSQPWIAWWWTPLTAWTFQTIANVYGFTTMPPMPPNPQQVAWRAKSVRTVIRFVHESIINPDGPGPVIGLVPEGHDMPGGKISMPPKGVGRFVGQLVKMGLIIIPVGVFISRRQLCLNFGKPYRPEIGASLAKDKLDEAISRQVMAHIAALAPEELRGEFL